MSYSSPEEERKYVSYLENVCQILLNKTDDADNFFPYCHGVLSLSEGGMDPHIPFTSMYDLPDPAKYVLVGIYVISLSVSLMGNSLVIVSFMFNRHMRSVMNAYIVSLAVSDFLMAATCSPINIGTALAKFWVIGPFACKAIPFMTSLSVASSSLTLCCIALDRYSAVVHPLKRIVTNNARRVALLLTAVWFISISASIPYALIYKIYLTCKDEKCTSKSHMCYESDGGLLTSLEMWLTLIVLLVLPLTIIGIAYGIIMWKLWSNGIVGTGTALAADLRTRHKKKAVKMMILVVFLFVFCWAPLLVFEVIRKKESLEQSQGSLILKFYLQWLALSSACYNPIIYAFMNERFRKNFAKILTCRRIRIAPTDKRILAVASKVAEPLPNRCTNRQASINYQIHPSPSILQQQTSGY